jgi:hypothetical protein
MLVTQRPLPLTPRVCVQSQRRQSGSFGHNLLAASSECHSGVSVASVASLQTSLHLPAGSSSKSTAAITRSAPALMLPGMPSCSASGGKCYTFQLTPFCAICRLQLRLFALRWQTLRAEAL